MCVKLTINRSAPPPAGFVPHPSDAPEITDLLRGEGCFLMAKRQLNRNRKQQRFIVEYLKDLNATQAAIRSGYSKKTAVKTASRLLTKADIQAEIEAKSAQKAQEAGVTVDKVVKESALIAFSDLSQFLEDCQTIEKPADWPPEVKRCIQSFKIIRTTTGSGDNKQETVRSEIKLWDKVASLEFLGKYLGMLKDKGDRAQVVILGADAFDKPEQAGLSG